MNRIGKHLSSFAILCLSTSLTLLTSFIGTLCYGQTPYTYTQPEELDDSWETNSLKALNVDTTRIYQLFNQIRNVKNKLHGVLLIKNGQLIVEEYFNEYVANQPHDLRSVTKSIKSILLGIAIDKGFIDRIDDPISKYLKDKAPQKNKDSRKDEITIRHLMTMSTGLDCNDWDRRSKGQEDKVYRKKDWIQYTLDLPMVHDPGEVSSYCSMGTVILAEIMRKASGKTIQEFAQEYLFDPLGITQVDWGHTLEKEVLLSGKRLYMTPRDMGKIGKLILNNGKWKGKQVVSKLWVEESTIPKTKITGMDYGYLWWNIPFKVQGNVVVSKTATGNGGQYIMVIPEMQIVAVFTGGAYNSEEAKLAFAIMQDIFLPTFVNGG